MRVIAILIATTLLASCGIADWANNTFPTYHNRKCTGWWCDESDWERNSQPSSSGAGAYPRRSVGGGSAPSPYGGAPSPYGSAPAQGTGGSYGMPPSAPSPYSGG